MSAIIWTDVTDMAPELTGKLAPLAQSGILAVVNTQLKVGDWGGESDPSLRLGRIYLAAHYGTLTTRRGVAGPLTSQSADGISRSYGAVQGATRYDSTSYGQLFRMLARTKSFRAGSSSGFLPGFSSGTGDPLD